MGDVVPFKKERTLSADERIMDLVGGMTITNVRISPDGVRITISNGEVLTIAVEKLVGRQNLIVQIGETSITNNLLC
jgi:hypothetical protein